MSFWTKFRSWLEERPGGGVAECPWSDQFEINPATCLPMNGGVDVLGNPMGTDLHSTNYWHHEHDAHRTSSCFDDQSFHAASVYDPDRGW